MPRNHLTRNILWLLSSRLGAQGLMVLFTILIARRLGSTGFGAYAFITAVVFVGNALTTFGTDMLLIRQIAGQGDLAQLPASLLIQLFLSIFYIIIVWLAAPILPNQSSAAIVSLRIFSLALIPLAFFTVFTTALRGTQRMDTYTLLNLSSAVLQTGIAVLLVRSAASLVTLASLLLGVQVVSALLAGAICSWRIPGFWQSWHFSLRAILPLLRACMPLALLTISGIIYQKLSVYMITSINGAEVTGWFAAAQRTVEASKTAHQAVFTALYPAMAQAWLAQGNQASRLPSWRGSFSLSMKLLLASAASAALILSLLAAPLTGILFGRGYSQAAPALSILAWMLLPWTANTFMSLSFLSASKERSVLLIQLVGLALLAGLNAWWIPLWGLTGACLASLIAESSMTVVYLFPFETIRNRAAHLSRSA